MKTRILFIIGVLLMVNTVKANTSNKQPNTKWDYSYYDAEPISFKERGIKFFIFPDGEMDFDIHANNYGNTTEYYYKGKNKSRNNRYHRGTKVVRDFRGRIIRVGNVFINYNHRGKIKRVGSVSINYRRNLLTRVGGLRLIYDRYGTVRYIGRVKHHYFPRNYYRNYYQNFYNNYFYDNFVYNYHDSFFNNNDFSNNYEQFNEDDDYYYYRSKGTTSKMKNGKKEVKQKMIKRKKQIKRGKY